MHFNLANTSTAEFDAAGAEVFIFRRLAAVPQLGDQGARHGKCRALGEHACLRGAGLGAVSHGVRPPMSV